MTTTRFTVGYTFPLHSRHTFRAESPELQKAAKDTRLANDYWQTARFDRFDFRHFLNFSEDRVHIRHISDTFSHFLPEEARGQGASALLLGV